MVRNNNDKYHLRGVRGTRKAKKGSPYEPLFGRQTDTQTDRNHVTCVWWVWPAPMLWSDS